jgi:hypothetical protein
MASEVEIKWLAEPEDRDYPAGGSCLSLLYDEPAATNYVDLLRKAPISKFKAKDIFRASGLSLLGVSDSHVEHDREKVLAGQSLSPLLLVRASSNPQPTNQGPAFTRALSFCRLCRKRARRERAMGCSSMWNKFEHVRLHLTGLHVSARATGTIQCFTVSPPSLRVPRSGSAPGQAGIGECLVNARAKLPE